MFVRLFYSLRKFEFWSTNMLFIIPHIPTETSGLIFLFYTGSCCVEETPS